MAGRGGGERSGVAWRGVRGILGRRVWGRVADSARLTEKIMREADNGVK